MPMLPLFPLSSVLFPGATLPLHIFEPRYQFMIGECVEQEQHFGVVLIQSGEEVGVTAEPHKVGTTARIVGVQRLPDGRMNIVTIGVRRFRIVALDRSRPYLSGDVEYIDRTDQEDEATMSEAVRVRELFSKYYRQTLALADQWTRRVGLPIHPGMLADFVAGRLEVDTNIKQKLLELDSTRECLEIESTMLDEAVALLSDRVRSSQMKKFSDFGTLN